MLQALLLLLLGFPLLLLPAALVSLRLLTLLPSMLLAEPVQALAIALKA
jgi:hypothetical protein